MRVALDTNFLIGVRNTGEALNALCVDVMRRLGEMSRDDDFDGDIVVPAIVVAELVSSTRPGANNIDSIIEDLGGDEVMREFLDDAAIITGEISRHLKNQKDWPWRNKQLESRFQAKLRQEYTTNDVMIVATAIQEGSEYILSHDEDMDLIVEAANECGYPITLVNVVTTHNQIGAYGSPLPGAQVDLVEHIERAQPTATLSSSEEE